MTDAVRTQALSKTFPGGVRAVREVDLTVRTGEVFGLLGPNGAGKTTLTSLLTTVLAPTGGRAEVGGIDVTADPAGVRRRIGLVFQRSTADETLTGRENLEIAAGLNGMSPAEARPRIRDLLEEMELSEAADRSVKGYSGGMQRRLEIAVALVHEPATLFLDEPTLGLDPQGRLSFWRFLRELRRFHPVTVCLTTHYLDEADQLCDRLAILDGGRIRALGTPMELKARLGGDTVVVEVGAPDPRIPEILRAVPGVESVEASADGRYRAKVDGGSSRVPALVRACDARGIELTGVSTRRPTLDEVFLSVTGRVYHPEAPAYAAPGDGAAAEPVGRG